MNQRVCLVLLLLLHGALRAGAQSSRSIFDPEDEPRTFYGALVGGCNVSQVDGDGFSGYHKLGFNAGAEVLVRFNENIGVSLDMLYSQKGSLDKRYSGDDFGNTYYNEYRLKLNYISIPLMLRVVGGNHFNYALGASYDLLISSEEMFTTAYSSGTINPEGFPFQKGSVNAVGGFGYEFSKGWFIDARYEYSMTTIRKPLNIPVGYGGGVFPHQFNNVVTFRLAYFFHSRK